MKRFEVNFIPTGPRKGRVDVSYNLPAASRLEAVANAKAWLKIEAPGTYKLGLVRELAA